MAEKRIGKEKRNGHWHNFSHPWHSLNELQAEKFSKIELLGWIETMANSKSPYAGEYRKVFSFLLKNGEAGGRMRRHVEELVLLMRTIRADVEGGLILHLDRFFEAEILM